MQEERFLRIKSPSGVLPIESVRACLDIAGLSIEDVDLVVHPGATIDGIASRVEVYVRHFFGSPPRVESIHHHLAHLASAYYACELEGGVAVSYDAWGDRVSTAVVTARAGRLHIIDTKERDQSLGLF